MGWNAPIVTRICTGYPLAVVGYCALFIKAFHDIQEKRPHLIRIESLFAVICVQGYRDLQARAVHGKAVEDW